METTFVVQGLHMKLDFDKNDSLGIASEAHNFKVGMDTNLHSIS